jgi:hypothetical protein
MKVMSGMVEVRVRPAGSTASGGWSAPILADHRPSPFDLYAPRAAHCLPASVARSRRKARFIYILHRM